MLKGLTKKIFGDPYQREMKKISPILEQIKEIYPSLEKLSDDDLKNRIQEIKQDIRNRLEDQENELAELQKKYQLEPDENKKNSK